ncbi:MAG: hypothetical protein WBO34_04865 [Gammaproteobacteria bacterium]
MTKTLGFLTGVSLTVASFVLVLDRWQYGQTGEELLAMVATDVGPLDAAPNATDKVSVTIGDEPDTLSVEAVTDYSASSATPAADAEKAATVDPDAVIPPLLHPGIEKAEQQSASVVQPAAEPATAVVKQIPGVSAESVDSPALNRDLQVDTGGHDTALTHVFWSPFRSEWAAKGFARRLTNATQIPIEIVEAGSGQYRVSFDYRDEVQRQEHVERIESITGLQLE